MADEVEGKLILTSPDRAAVIEAIATLDEAGGYTVVRRTEHSLSDAYYDTHVRDLASARLALRVRGEDGRERITVKAEGRVQDGVVSRYELERDWSPDALREVLEAVGSRGVILDKSRPDVTNGAVAAFRSLGLYPTSPRKNQRTALALAGVTGAIIAELDVDRVTFTAGEVIVRHYEVECEAHDDTGSAVIRSILDDLRGRFEGLHAVTYSKLDLAEHLQRLAITDTLTPLLDGDILTPRAYAQIALELS